MNSPQQLTLFEIPPKVERTVSYSQYLSYRTCQYQWYLQYVKKEIEFRPTINLVFGTSMHETLQHYFTVMYNKSGKKADEEDLETLFKERFITEYKNRVGANNGIHFATAEELQEFFEDGLNIIQWIKRYRARYFSLRNMELVGIEIPLLIQANKEIKGVSFKGFVDFIVKDTKYNTYTIYDIKTSTRGWSSDDKKNPNKVNQVLLYKKFFAETNNIPEEDIDVKFFVVRRKIAKTEDFVIPRVQEFSPANGKLKMKKALEDFNQFLFEVFDSNGAHKEQDYRKNVGSACKWCVFGDKPNLCDKKVLVT